MKFIKWLGGAIVFIVLAIMSFTSNIFTIFGTNINQVKDHNKTHEIVHIIEDSYTKYNLIENIPLILISILVILILMFHKRILFFIKTFDPFLLRSILNDIHEFQHIYIRQLNQYKGSDNKSGNREIYTLLEHIRKILSYIDKDISVNLKIFENTNSGAYQIVSKNVENTVLITFERAPSYREMYNDKLGQRSATETYKVNASYDANYLHENNGRGCIKIKCNSSFNYILGNNEHYCIYNDLENEEKKKKYYSSSDNWIQYYKCSAVFLVAPQQPNGVGAVKDALAFLIADSPNKYAFSNKFIIKALMGYFSHRMYSFIRNTIIKQ